MFKHLTITPNRLINTIHETAKFGAKGVWGTEATQTGVCRLALSDLDKQVRDWFIEECTKLGCEIKIDAMGSIFATYPGRNPGPPTAIGSHLDTQPTGGRYDGVLGVLSGLEVIRTMKDNNFTPNYPITVINWTNEEGARWPKPLMTSSVWAEMADLDATYSLKLITDEIPKTVLEELERIGYKGDVPASYKANPIKCHFEIHIEQGPILEEQNRKIGVVVGVQAYNWTKVKVKGKATHTGSTPFHARSDALLAASKMMVKGNEIAQKHNGLLTVGVLELLPSVVNVIPDEVNFIVDCRHVDDNIHHKIIQEYQDEFRKIIGESGKKLSIQFEHLDGVPATKFHDSCIDCVRTSAIELFGESNYLDMVSGPAHDSCATNRQVPTSMIFIPSKDGVSHNPEEYSTPEQVAEGFEVLMNAVLKYDSLRTD